MSIEQDLQAFLAARKHEVDWGVVAQVVRDLTEELNYTFIDRRTKQLVEVLIVNGQPRKE